jgi:hypothetical protein
MEVVVEVEEEEEEEEEEKRGNSIHEQRAQKENV